MKKLKKKKFKHNHNFDILQENMFSLRESNLTTIGDDEWGKILGEFLEATDIYYCFFVSKEVYANTLLATEKPTFVANSTVVIDREIYKWLKMNNIRTNVLRQRVITYDSIETFENGELNCWDDEPSFVTRRWQMYHLNGELGRHDGLPSKESVDGIKEWYLFNVLIRREQSILLNTGEVVIRVTCTGHYNPDQKCFSKIIFFDKNGLMHKENGPAVELEDGTRKFYCHGRLHNLNNPALERSDGSCFYYVHGRLHRDNNLPAVELANGDCMYCQNGLLHRDGNLPAVELTDGTRKWYKDGQLDRVEFWLV